MPIFRALQQQLAKPVVEACKQTILACAGFLMAFKKPGMAARYFPENTVFSLKYA
jgi:hypothetical protein